MNSNWKYVVFEGDLGIEYPVIFPPYTNHSSIRDLSGKAISAGFVIFEDGILIPYGESVTLKLKSRPKDQKLLNKLFEK